MVERVADSHDDELALAERGARGDHTAFGAIVRAYEPRLLAYLVQMLGDPEAARDAAQETFIAAFRALPRWRPPDDSRADPSRPLSPWLYRIATNKALSLLHASSARPPVAATTHASTGHSDAEGGFEERYAARELMQGASTSTSRPSRPASRWRHRTRAGQRATMGTAPPCCAATRALGLLCIMASEPRTRRTFAFSGRVRRIAHPIGHLHIVQFRIT